MSGGKDFKRQLKGPDAFQVKMFSILGALAKRKSLILSLLAAIAVIGAGSMAFEYFSEHKDVSRKVELAKIDTIYNTELESVSKDQAALQMQVTELRMKLPADPKDKKPEHAKIETEIKSLEDKMGALKGNHEGSLAQFKSFYEKYPDAPEGWVAGMRYATAMLEQDKLADARPILDHIFNKSRDSIVYQVQSGMALIGILEDSGEYDAALEKTETLLKSVPDTLKPKILLTKSRLQLQKNAKADAGATLEGLIKDHAATPEADQARGMKALIN